MAIATKEDLLKRVLEGRADYAMSLMTATTATSAASATCGQITMAFTGNVLGTTFPGTLVDWQSSPATGDKFNLLSIYSTATAARGTGLVRLYRIGTLNLTATGDQFTHDAATFPVTRTMYGSTRAVPLVPVILVTTATSVTAPAFQLQTNAGGAGYVDQDGNNVIGTRTITFPAAATVSGSAFILPLELTDNAITDIIQIKVTTASSTGAATLYGMEFISFMSNLSANASQFDNFYGAGLFVANNSPAVATSGTATSLRVQLGQASSAYTGMMFNESILS